MQVLSGTVPAVHETDGTWRIVGYFVQVHAAVEIEVVDTGDVDGVDI